MAYKQFLWKNQVVNDERVKFIRVRIFEVAKDSKKRCNDWESGYSDGQFRGNLSERFTITILIGQIDTGQENKVIKVRVFITPEFQKETLEELYRDFYEFDKQVYNYIQESMEKYFDNKIKNVK